MLALHNHSRHAGLVASLVALPLLAMPQQLHALIRPTLESPTITLEADSATTRSLASILREMEDAAALDRRFTRHSPAQ